VQKLRYPLDSPIDATLPDASKAIYKANRELIDGADAVLANLRDFRGFEPDSGTVWEVAYALAKGKTVIGYLPTAASILQRMGNIPQDGVDEAGCTVENFGLPLNLMLAHSLSAIAYGEESSHEGLKAALAKLKEFCVVGV
jgi:nucleoside 2-deoxyribosyltransferase